MLGLASILFFPSEAFAHASDRGFVLLLPTGYYLMGGALAVLASFFALFVLPPGLLSRIAAPRLTLIPLGEGMRLVLSFATLAVLAALVFAGFAGSRDPLSNPLPLMVWTVVWIGLTLVQGIAGDLWWWINPWHAPARLVQRLRGRERIVSLPRGLRYWPAVVLFLGFAWFELIYPAPDDPARLALVVAAYYLFNLGAAVLFGAETWLARGEALSVFFSMVARFGVLDWTGARGGLGLRWPGAKLWNTPALPLAGALFMLLVLASVSFDGLSKTFFWLGLNGINPLEYPGRTALMQTNTLGLLAACAALSAAFFGAVALGELMSGRRMFRAAAGTLVWSLVPIALAYHFAHYLTALAVNAQYALVALSDPLSNGWNLFGTANWQVSAGVVSGSGSAWLLWNLQAGAIIAGHVLGVLAAHLLAGRLPPAPRAMLAELPLTALMVAYTVFGLWLLSTPTAG